MKAKLLFLMSLFMIVVFSAAAQNRWGVVGGVNLSTTSAKGFTRGFFGNHFTYGLKGGVSVEHKHWFVSMDCKYSLKTNFVNYGGHGLTLSAGIGYKF